MTFGVTPQGFTRPTLSQILDQIEAEARAQFGPSVIQSAESPLGQLNGMFANLANILWEYAEDVYQSYDPDQAEGVRLPMLGKLRLLERAEGESDASLRQAITNAGRARIDLQDITRAVRNLSGVTYTQVWLNDGDAVDENGISGHSVAVAVLGGADGDIAATVRDYVVPGIGSHGNIRVETTIDGFCRSINILRPEEVPIWLNLTAKFSNDRLGCPPPSPTALAIFIAQELSGDNRPANGADPSLHMIRTVVSAVHPNVEIMSGKAGRSETTLADLPLVLAFDEIASFAPERITISIA